MEKRFDLRPQHRPARVEPRMMSGGIDEVVKVNVERDDAVQVSVIDRPTDAFDGFGEGRKIVVGRVLRRALDSELFQGAAQFVDLVDIGPRQPGDARAPMALECEKSFALEFDERFANRAAADAELLGQTGFVEVLAGFERTAHQCRAQQIDDIFRKAAAIRKR